ncbi:MAG: hypothetical protein JO293_01710 [Candidatus Eremiobacteraeota bacterium]|nr:hypothetical protein [Candidatus Eremiobacteraeota bacterium]
MLMLGRIASSCAALLAAGAILFPGTAFAVAGPGNSNAPVMQNAYVPNPCANWPKTVGFTVNPPKSFGVAPAPVHSAPSAGSIALSPSQPNQAKPAPTPAPTLSPNCAYLSMTATVSDQVHCTDYSVSVFRNGTPISTSSAAGTLARPGNNQAKPSCTFMLPNAVPVSVPLQLSIQNVMQPGKQSLPTLTIPSSYAGGKTYAQTFTFPF